MIDPRGLTSSQKGTISELYVSATLVSASNGRLSPFVPVTDDHGLDLLVYDKVSGGTASVQIKSWLTKLDNKRKTAQFDVRKATYSHPGRSALIALVLEPTSLAFETSWLIPMLDIPSVAVESKEKYALSPSRSPSSRDRYSDYRHRTPESLVSSLISLVEQA